MCPCPQLCAYVMAELSYVCSCLGANPEENVFFLNFQNFKIVNISISHLALDCAPDWWELLYFPHKRLACFPYLVFRNFLMQVHYANVFFSFRKEGLHNPCCPACCNWQYSCNACVQCS